MPVYLEKGDLFKLGFTQITSNFTKKNIESKLQDYVKFNLDVPKAIENDRQKIGILIYRVVFAIADKLT